MPCTVCAMPERPDEPDYDWLYGTQRKGVGGGRPAGSDDATAAQPRPDQGNAPRDPEPTRMLPTVDRPAGRRAGTGGPFETPPAAGARRGSAGSGGGSRGPGRGTAPMASPPSSRRRPWKRIVAIVVGLWLVFLVAVPLIAWSKIEKVDATPAGD